MKAKMLKFIRWFIMADAQIMDGDLMDYQISCHEGDMPDDQISLCKMEDRDNWDNPVVLDSTNVIAIDYASVLESKKQINCAVVTIEDAGEEIKYTFRRLFYENTLEDCMEQIFVLSTGHVTQEDAKVLNESESMRDLVVHQYSEYGWIVVMPDDVTVTRSILGTVFSDAFWDILKDVRYHYPDCNRIQFDRDASLLNAFPQFDW